MEESFGRLVHLYRKTNLRKPDEFVFARKSKELFDVVVHTGCLSIDASTFGIACSRMTPVFDCWKRIATCVSALQAEIICLDDPLKP
jgi:hypothetical protein